MREWGSAVSEPSLVASISSKQWLNRVGYPPLAEETLKPSDQIRNKGQEEEGQESEDREGEDQEDEGQEKYS